MKNIWFWLKHKLFWRCPVCGAYSADEGNGEFCTRQQCGWSVQKSRSEVSHGQKQDFTFGVFGLSCKAIFHTLGFIAAYKWNVNVFIFLLIMVIMHNLLSLLHVKNRTGNWAAKVKIKNWKK